MDNTETKLNKKDALHIAVIVCSFIPFWGIIVAWYRKHKLIKTPLFLLYHLITLIMVAFLMLKELISSV